MASNINSVVVSGRLTADPETKTVNGQVVFEGRIAIGRSYRQGEDWVETASFVGVAVWGGRASHIARVCKKGDLLTFAGEIRSSEWKADDGTNRSRVYVLAQSVEGEALFRKAETADQPAEEQLAGVA